MKKLIKHLSLLFAVIFVVAAVGMAVSGCDNKKPSAETGLTLPSTQTSTTTVDQTASTVPSVTTDETTPPIVTTKETETQPISTTSPVVPVENGTYINPLTGLKTLDASPANSRPVAIVIDNIQYAYANQKGLGQADVIYEALVAPGITRYLAVVQDYEKLSAIGNIRSARDYHLDVALGHNAILVSHGGSISSNYDFFALVVSKLGPKTPGAIGSIDAYKFVNTLHEPMFAWADYTTKYGTIQNYKSRKDINYDTVVNGTALKLVIAGSITSLFKKAGGTANGAPKGFTFAANGTSNVTTGLSATDVDVHFTCTGAAGTKYVEFKYDSASGQYVRYQDKKFSGAGEILSFKNVLVLGTEVKNAKGTTEDPNMTLVKATGSGSGYYFVDGKAVKIRWNKTSDTAPYRFYLDGALTELELSAGKTYIGFVESSYVTSTFFN